MPLHQVLNRLLPMSVRVAGRKLAQATIPSLRHLDMPTRLRALRDAGLAPGAIFDVGAANGEWARLAHSIWPDARIVGFEPNAREVPALEQTRRELPAFDFVTGFLGAESKTVKYLDAHTQTSLFADDAARDAHGNAGVAAESPMHVLDELLAAGRVPQPQLVKLDVQGYELEVLRGATRTLAAAEAVVMEVTFARFHAGMPIIDDVLPFMLERGFAWYDIAGIIRRPEDDRLMQIDAVFVKRGHPLLRETV